MRRIGIELSPSNFSRPSYPMEECEFPKDILMDALWPEESPKAAENNFKTTLQRLRKSLRTLNSE
jgi:two-component SAPR family response regulator